MAQQPSQVRDAVIRGHKIELMRALDRDPTLVNEQDCDNVTLLMDAASNNHINILTMLLEHKAQVDPSNRLGRTALMEAACRGHPAITLRLCQSRPNLNYTNNRHPLNMSSLMEAASRGHAGVTFWLCEAKADVNLTNSSGDTALILAAHNNRYDAVEVLIAQGANTEIAGDNGRTALQVAVERGNTKIVNLLQKYKGQSKEALQGLCQELKKKQKAILQDEVNYDASVLSRKLPPYPSYETLPAFREEFVHIIIPHNRGVNSVEYAERQRQFELKQSAAGSTGHPSQPPMAPFGLTVQDYPTPPFKYDPTRHVPRTKPFKLLPKFGSCSFISLSSRRVHGSSPSRTRHKRIEEHNDVIKSNNAPTLTLFDNGNWTYKNDLVSGNLEGTFTINQSITHGTLSHINNVPHEPLLVSEGDFYWEQVGDLSTLTENDISIEEGGVTFRRVDTQPFDPEYDWKNYQPSYLIQLRTGGEDDGDSKCNTPLQIVDCYLGKQFVLGQLIMEMVDNECPWWQYIDEQEERLEWHQYEIDRAEQEHHEQQQQQQQQSHQHHHQQQQSQPPQQSQHQQHQQQPPQQSQQQPQQQPQQQQPQQQQQQQQQQQRGVSPHSPASSAASNHGDDSRSPHQHLQ